ncbi:MAG: metallopeptidase TldD-related protein, partial [Candidatus Subteraquimicrobiales bacterium]|nr:metallopeptidase TldD-related protein [Candidatus Subteraquimicrobiales bacterium]
SVIAFSDTSSGYANCLCKDIREVNVEDLAKKACDKALKGKNTVTIKPGAYTVILEPNAVADMLVFLSYVGFSALSVQEKRSFMCGRFGEKVTGENITLWDDALSTETIGVPFDFEGVPKEKVVLIENGIARNVVYDSYTANLEGKESSGHALLYPNLYGPQAANLFLQKGNSNFKEMVKSTKEGILVTRFHYTNIEDPMKTTLTGVTRDGTFLIENGEITKGIKNLRFTQSILEALANVEMISKETALKEGFFGVVKVPALKIGRFNFTGLTE